MRLLRNDPVCPLYNNVYKRKQDHTGYDLKDDVVDRDLKYRIRNYPLNHLCDREQDCKRNK